MKGKADMVIGLALCVLMLCLPAGAMVFVPLDNLVLIHSAAPTDAEILAIESFSRRVYAFTGTRIPVEKQRPDINSPCILMGTVASMPETAAHAFENKDLPDDMDARNQSYCISVSGGTSKSIYVFGAGAEETARASLGLSYALGELLRALEIREGVWGFVLPESPVYRTPSMVHRTLYLNLDAMRPAGVALEQMTDADLKEYADFLLEARYTRISFWQTHPNYLYPGNAEYRRADNERMHRNMQVLFQYARSRGIEIYHQLTPGYLDPALVGDPEEYSGEGWYSRQPGYGGICWNIPRAREVALDVARYEMEYFGHIDGYVVWYYDPGGCFCDTCKPGQADVLFDQIRAVSEIAETISPGAAIQAVLWPTWIFPEYEDKGIPFNEQERDAFVSAYLAKTAEHFGPRTVSIVDSCEIDASNLYRGLVDPELFRRTGFVFSVLGYPGEAGYLFMPFRFEYQREITTRAIETNLDEVMLYDHFGPVTRPLVFGIAYMLYDAETTYTDTINAYTAACAKGKAHEQYRELLTLLDGLEETSTYTGRAELIQNAELIWETLRDLPYFVENKDWLDGYIRGQKQYLAMAQAHDPDVFEELFKAFQEDMADNAVYARYVGSFLTSKMILEYQIVPYWRSPCGDGETTAIPDII